ncbi:Hypothetical protein ORPV_267 [Orpheovirus IHUMI-LCC2]|uniref:Uncharacterized protein n=1 Tax=Orpheovirus IHUMI-LCC2 TaxID=2023057 RepID=A0A2I2L3T2_9VIRU|nr:Hypothetical protein ORPV_267 [Orpheovirus IHUMI-LCC2]SNW62171.1 Hypothetical protein ORPV_267 [Orpheovirus IHUMI-LCC2]
MDTLPNEIVLNEILRFMDQRTALNFLMSNVKYRHIVEENFEKYFPSEKYYKPQDKISKKGKKLIENGIFWYKEVDMDKVVRDDAVINIKKFISMRMMTIPNILYHAQIMDNFELFNDYKDFMGVYGMRFGKDDDNDDDPETDKIYLQRDRQSLHNYKISKSEDPRYDSSLRFLKILIYNMEEKLLMGGSRSKIDEYRDMLREFSLDGYNDVVKFILDNIYVSDYDIGIISDTNNLDMTKYALQRYIENGGLLSQLDNDLFIGASEGVVDMGYIPVFQYLLSIIDIPYDLKDLYDRIHDNEELDEDVREALIKEINKYYVELY